ncbi:MAG: hypothetical protein U5L06_07985 [Rhodovibrio sp.]|nr:hypothetical protein [Rhodovibrio sp.]
MAAIPLTETLSHRSSAQALAAKKRQRIDANQELTGLEQNR